IARCLGDEIIMANVLHIRGLAAYLAGDTDEAAEILTEALHRCQEIGDRHFEWMALFHLVVVHSTQGNVELADSLAKKCLAMCETNSAYMSKSNALWLLGFGRWLQGEQKAASDLVRKGLVIMRTWKDSLGIAECVEVLAWVAAAEGKEMRAAQL